MLAPTTAAPVTTTAALANTTEQTDPALERLKNRACVRNTRMYCILSTVLLTYMDNDQLQKNIRLKSTGSLLASNLGVQYWL